MLRCPDRLSLWIWTRRWSVLPAPVWAVAVSPLLAWASGRGPWFVWPSGCSRSPLRPSFWFVDWCLCSSWGEALAWRRRSERDIDWE